MTTKGKKKEKKDSNDDDRFFNRLMQGKFPIKKKANSPVDEKQAAEKKEKKPSKLVGFITKPYRYIKRKIQTTQVDGNVQAGTSKKALSEDATRKQQQQTQVYRTKTIDTSSKKVTKPKTGRKPRTDIDVELSSGKNELDASSKKSMKPRKKSTLVELDQSTKQTKPTEDETSTKSVKTRKGKKRTPEVISLKKPALDEEYEFIFADNIRAGLQTLKKNFISRPYQPKSMKRMLERLAKRQKRGSEAVLNNAETPVPHKHEVAPFEDVMPKASTSVTVKPPTISMSSLRTKSSIVTATDRTEEETRASLCEDDDDFTKKYKPVLTNKTNHGRLFLPNGKPFWQSGGEDSDVDDEEEPTDDELPMNADVIEDVYEGKTKLVPMPSDPVTLNPYAPMSELQKRDALYFTKGIIFSNTVRSLLNLNDELTDIEHRQNEKSSKSQKTQMRKPTFFEPTHVMIYDRKEPARVLRHIPIDVYRAETDGLSSGE